MDAILFSLMTLAGQWLLPRYNASMQLLEAQIRMLRSRIDASRIVPTPEERTELLRLGAATDHDIDELMHVVLPETYKKRLRQLRGEKKFRPSGRPRTALAIRQLVMRFAKENMRWGCGRIVGEFKKPGIRIGATTIRDILKREGFTPDPSRARKNPPIPWTTFVHANLDSIVSCDFLAKRILSLSGFRDAYVLAFIRLGRRIHFRTPWNCPRRALDELTNATSRKAMRFRNRTHYFRPRASRIRRSSSQSVGS